MTMSAVRHSDCATRSPGRDADKYHCVASRPGEVKFACKLASIAVYFLLILLLVGFDEMRRSLGFVGGFLLGLIQAASIPRWRNDSLHELRFSDDGTFQLSIFEDLHFGESKCVIFLDVLVH